MQDSLTLILHFLGFTKERKITRQTAADLAAMRAFDNLPASSDTEFKDLLLECYNEATGSNFTGIGKYYGSERSKKGHLCCDGQFGLCGSPDLHAPPFSLRVSIGNLRSVRELDIVFAGEPAQHNIQKYITVYD